MKYISKIIFAFALILSVICMGKVNADTFTITPNEESVSYDSLTGVEVYNAFVTGVGDNNGFYTMDLSIDLINVTFTSIEFGPSWYVTKIDDLHYKLETKENGIPTTKTLVAKLTVTKIKKEQECKVIFDYSLDKSSRICTNTNGAFYGKDGLITDEATYKKECFACQKKDDGTFYNADGEKVDELDYKKSCEKPKCNKYEDGTFSNSVGELVDELTYRKDCEKPVCTIYEDGTYSDEKGNIVTKEQFESACTNPPTGSFVPYVISIGGCLSLIGIVIFTRNKTKMYKV